MKYNWTTAEAWGKTAAVLLLGAAVYGAFCVFCVTVLPVGADVGIAAGVLGGFPVWVAAVYYAVLARTVVRAWGVLGGAALLLAGASLVAELLV